MSSASPFTPSYVPAPSRPGSPRPPGDEDRRGVSVAGLLLPLLRSRALIVRLALLGGILAALYAWTRDRHYTSNVAFMPQAARSGGGGASALASQLGIALGAGDASQSPQFYLDLMTSRGILQPLVESTYRARLQGQVREGTLVELLGIPRDRPQPLRVQAASSVVAASMATSVARTGVIRVAVRASSPDLAQQIGQRLVALLNEFNLHTRQTQAAAERRFAEQRLADVRADLRRAENNLQDFLSANREYQTSPTLLFERTRLDRELNLQQQRYFAITQAYEQAKLEEVRDTPLLTVIESPSLPVLPDSRDVIRIGVLGGIVGLTLGVLIAWARAVSAAAAEGDDATAEEYAALRGELASDLRRPWRLVGPSRRRAS